MEVRDGLFYAATHEWVEIDREHSTARIGLTPIATEKLGEIVFVELPELEEEFAQGEEFGVVESVKAASPVFSPVSGRVIRTNEALEETPEALNDAPYDCFLIELALTDEVEEELSQLLSGEGYRTSCEEGE